MTLSEWLAREKKTDAWLAERVECDRSFITRLRTGAKRPSLKTMELILAITSGEVSPMDFLKTREAAE